jgi:putative tricarboxylic transport membrane protein
MDLAHITNSFFNGLFSLFHLNVQLGIAVGVFLGLVVGLLPAIGASMIIVLILPFIFGADPIFALPMLASIMAVNYTAGSVTAVLMGIPGSTASVATVLDGFAMTKKGLGGRGVGAALAASALGGVGAVVFAILMMPVVIPIVLAFKSAEMFCIILLAMCFIATVSKGSTTKGLISGCIGMLLGFVGYHQTTGADRWTFGSIYVYDGISIVSVMLGLFALTILLDMRLSDKSIAPVDTAQAGDMRELWKGVKEVFNHLGLWFRCTVIGYIVGVIPGVGAETAIWVAYGHAKMASKDPSSFGTGNIEGVIAPESANNAKEAGAFLTTMAFGIPGSVGMSYMLVAFMVVGLQPGPRMITEHTNVCFAILQTIAIANVLGAAVCFFGATLLIKATRVPPIYLFVTIMPLTLIGAYNENALLSDIVIMFIITVLGLFMHKTRYPFAPAVLGYVLAPIFELYFWRASSLGGPLFFMTPISIVLILCTIFMLGNNFFMSSFKRLLGPRGRKAV